MQIDERRKYPRLAFSANVEYRILNQKEKEVHLSSSQSKNVSAGGLRIIVSEKVIPEAMLELKFLLPGLNVTIATIGKVAWVEKFIVGDNTSFEAGVEFITINEEDREKIKKFVIENIKP